MCHDYVFLNPGYEKNLNPHRAFLRIENMFFIFSIMLLLEEEQVFGSTLVPGALFPYPPWGNGGTMKLKKKKRLAQVSNG